MATAQTVVLGYYHLLAFAGATFLFFVAHTIYLCVRHNRFKVPLKPILWRIVLFTVAPAVLHSILGYCLYWLAVQLYPFLQQIPICVIVGFLFAFFPSLGFQVVLRKYSEMLHGFFPLFYELITVANEVYALNIKNEINLQLRYIASEILEQHRADQYRPIHLIFERTKTQIAEAYRDGVFRDAKRAYGIFKIRNVEVKNNYLLEFFGYRNYVRQLESVRKTLSSGHHDPAAWDGVERRRGQEPKKRFKRPKRFYEKNDFKRRFLNQPMKK